jgi:hypothetical protein
MKKAEKEKKPDFARRPAGKPLFQPPNPRPIPADHPAKALFKVNSEPTHIAPPTVTPTAAATATTTEATTDSHIKPESSPQKSIPSSAQRRPLVAQTRPEPDALAQEAPKRFEYLDATHTSSEQLVYSYMFRQTISQNLRDRHFGPAELMKNTPIRSHVTVRKAIDGLIAKLSIEIVSFVPGSPFGPRYRVYDPREIMRRRQQANIQIDPVTKRIATPTVTATEATTEAPPTPTATPINSVGGSATDSGGVTPTISVGVLNTANKSGEGQGFTASSSSKSEANEPDSDDDEGSVIYLENIREIYERATGNVWTTADAGVVMSAKEIPVEVWGIAICYCLDRAPGHTYQRLAYVLEEARAHHESMKAYTKEDLRAILKHSVRMVERAREAGSWDPKVILETRSEG